MWPREHVYTHGVKNMTKNCQIFRLENSFFWKKLAFLSGAQGVPKIFSTLTFWILTDIGNVTMKKSKEMFWDQVWRFFALIKLHFSTSLANNAYISYAHISRNIWNTREKFYRHVFIVISHQIMQNEQIWRTLLPKCSKIVPLLQTMSLKP